MLTPGNSNSTIEMGPEVTRLVENKQKSQKKETEKK